MISSIDSQQGGGYPGTTRVPGGRDLVGVVTVCLGGLYLVWLLARETSRR